jgi:hypothetical protein
MRNWKRVTGLILVVIIVASFFGLRVAHPKGGLKSALGPAHSSLAIYWKGNSAKVGDKIVYLSSDNKINPSLGIVFGANPTFYDVKNGTFLEGIKPKNVRGKLVIVIPFLGWLF